MKLIITHHTLIPERQYAAQIASCPPSVMYANTARYIETKNFSKVLSSMPFSDAEALVLNGETANLTSSVGLVTTRTMQAETAETANRPRHLAHSIPFEQAVISSLHQRERSLVMEHPEDY